MNSNLFISEDGTYYILKVTKRRKQYEILFDKEDLNLVSPYQWKISKDGYAITNILNRYNHPIYFNMHRLIFEKHNGKVEEGFDVDHINNNRIDNRKQNLQKLTKAQNIQKAIKNTKSRHVGIYFDNERNKWRANYKNKYIGRYNTLEEALQAQMQYIANLSALNNSIKEIEEPKNEQQQQE